MAGRLTLARRPVVAFWRWFWDLPPYCCLRHWRDAMLRRPGTRDYGDPLCSRCQAPDHP